MDPSDLPTTRSAFSDIMDVRKRTYLVAFASSGHKARSAEKAGVDPSLPYAWQEDDPQFAEAFEIAERMAVDALNDEAMRRAVHGVTRYKFTRGGEPIRHPDQCVCGHHIDEHTRVGVGAARTFLCPGEDRDDLDARQFFGKPYVEHEYSDGLLTTLLKAHDPRFKDKLQLSGMMGNIALDQLPTEALSRIAGGEHPMAVLASLNEQNNRVQITPGPSDDDSGGSGGQ